MQCAGCIMFGTGCCHPLHTCSSSPLDTSLIAPSSSLDCGFRAGSWRVNRGRGGESGRKAGGQRGRRSVLLLNGTGSSSGIAHASRHIESSAVKGMAKSEEPRASVRRLKRPALRQRKQSLVENAEDDLCRRGSRAQSTSCLIHSPASASECRHSRHTHVQQTTARLPASPQHHSPPPPPSQPPPPSPPHRDTFSEDF